jgi:XapX domain-containing protein
MTATVRLSTLSFIVGLVAGLLYWSMHVAAPAPPWIALISLLGINLGERACDQLRRRRRQALLATEPGAATDET